MIRLRTHALVGFLVLALAAGWHHLPKLGPGAYNWAETGNIASALVQGRGFSDPFDGGTGPTAWVPPLPVLVDADVFLVGGIKSTASAALLMGLAVLGLSLAHLLIVGAVTIPRDRVQAGGWFRIAASVFFLGTLILLPSGPLEVQSEAWLIILLSLVLLRAALAHRARPGPRSRVGLVLAALLCPLAHAGLCLATAIVLVWLFVIDRRAGRPVRTVILAGAVAAAVLGGWTARNARVFHRLIPLKSNGWFEVYLTNVASPTGLLRAETAYRTLPFFNAAQFERYRVLGEIAFVDTYHGPAVAAIRADPGHFAKNVLTRAKNALAFCSEEDGSQVTYTLFSARDRLTLAGAGLLIPLGSPRLSAWLKIDDDPETAHDQIMDLHLQHGPAAWGDWAKSRAVYEETYHGIRPIVAGLLIAGFPLLMLFGTALARHGSLPASTLWATVIAAAMLAPFILVNHSARHQMPLLGLQAVVVGGCFQAWAQRLLAKAP